MIFDRTVNAALNWLNSCYALNFLDLNLLFLSHCCLRAQGDLSWHIFIFLYFFGWTDDSINAWATLNPFSRTCWNLLFEDRFSLLGVSHIFKHSLCDLHLNWASCSSGRPDLLNYFLFLLGGSCLDRHSLNGKLWLHISHIWGFKWGFLEHPIIDIIVRHSHGEEISLRHFRWDSLDRSWNIDDVRDWMLTAGVIIEFAWQHKVIIVSWLLGCLDGGASLLPESRLAICFFSLLEKRCAWWSI